MREDGEDLAYFTPPVVLHMFVDVIEHRLAHLDCRVDGKLVPQVLHVGQGEAGEDHAHLGVWMGKALAQHVV